MDDKDNKEKQENKNSKSLFIKFGTVALIVGGLVVGILMMGARDYVSFDSEVPISSDLEKKKFMTTCTIEATEAQCKCLISEINKELTYDEFKVMIEESQKIGQANEAYLALAKNCVSAK